MKTGLMSVMVAALVLAGCSDPAAEALQRAANQLSWERASCANSGNANSSACALYQHDSDELNEALMLRAAMNSGSGYVPPVQQPMPTRTHCWPSGDTIDCESY